MARQLLRLSERTRPLPARTTIGIGDTALVFLERFLPGSQIERLIARRFGLTQSGSAGTRRRLASARRLFNTDSNPKDRETPSQARASQRLTLVTWPQLR